MKTGKKWVKTVCNNTTNKCKQIYYGAAGYRIKPGTKYGDAYCARSYGINQKFPETAKNPNSPNNLSRAKWRCHGKKSMR